MIINNNSYCQFYIAISFLKWLLFLSLRKRFMKRIIIVICCFSTLLISAQAGNENVSYSGGNFFMRANRPNNKEYVIDGTPYVNGDKFAKVSIKGFGSNVQNLRYNAFDDEMEFQNNDELFYANKEENLIINFPDLNKKYKSLLYNYDGKKVFGYLVLLVDNPNYSLYKREKVELLKGEKSPNAYSKDANDYYSKMKDLFLISKDNVLTKFPKNVNEASEYFAIDKKTLSDFSKESKINFSKQEDLIKLVIFVNEKK